MLGTGDGAQSDITRRAGLTAPTSPQIARCSVRRYCISRPPLAAAIGALSLVSSSARGQPHRCLQVCGKRGQFSQVFGVASDRRTDQARLVVMA